MNLVILTKSFPNNKPDPEFLKFINDFTGVGHSVKTIEFSEKTKINFLIIDSSLEEAKIKLIGESVDVRNRVVLCKCYNQIKLHELL